MRQWDIFLFPFRVEQVHPAAIISPDERAANPDIKDVNALLCTSIRLNREPKIYEAILDEAGGLDWKTGVRCDLIYMLAKSEFRERRGRVSARRRVEIARKLFSVMRLPTH